jgi:hypothetical protein
MRKLLILLLTLSTIACSSRIPKQQNPSMPKKIQDEFNLANLVEVESFNLSNNTLSEFQQAEEQAKKRLGTLTGTNNNSVANQAEEISKARLNDKAIAPQRKLNLVSPGYLIGLNNIDDEQLNGEFRIGFDSILRLPYDININTEGLSETELKNNIISAYKKFFKSTPTLGVSVLEREFWIDVRGLVKNSGKYLVRKDASLDEILAKAGGLERNNSGEALAQAIRITQSGEVVTNINLNEYYSGKQLSMPEWEGGNLVFAQLQPETVTSSGITNKKISSSKAVQMVGQIKNPGELKFLPGADIFYYLVKAGGPTEKADLNRIMIVREANGKKQQKNMNIEQLQEAPVILPGDLILVNSDVPGEFKKRLDVAQAISGVFTSIGYMIILAFAI